MEYDELSTQLAKLEAKTEQKASELHDTTIAQRDLLKERAMADLDYFEGLLPYVREQHRIARELDYEHDMVVEGQRLFAKTAMQISGRTVLIDGEPLHLRYASRDLGFELAGLRDGYDEVTKPWQRA